MKMKVAPEPRGPITEDSTRLMLKLYRSGYQRELTINLRRGWPEERYRLEKEVFDRRVAFLTENNLEFQIVYTRYAEILYVLGKQLTKEEILSTYPNSRIVCAAIRYKEFTITSARHFDLLMHQQINLMKIKLTRAAVTQGFIDQFGNFLSRKEALYIAERENQIRRPEAVKPNALFSEALY